MKIQPFIAITPGKKSNHHTATNNHKGETMNFGFITSNDMKDFETKHKPAYNFLLHRSLSNEKKHLETNEYILNDYEKKRLAELSYLDD
jgi:hypothetical protein